MVLNLIVQYVKLTLPECRHLWQLLPALLMSLLQDALKEPHPLTFACCCSSSTSAASTAFPCCLLWKQKIHLCWCPQDNRAAAAVHSHAAWLLCKLIKYENKNFLTYPFQGLQHHHHSNLQHNNLFIKRTAVYDINLPWGCFCCCPTTYLTPPLLVRNWTSKGVCTLSFKR